VTPVVAALLFALYSIPSNSVIPLPHEPGVLYFALYAPAWALAVAGTVGTFAAAYADGFLVRWALDRPGGERLRADPTWQRLADWLTRWPMPTLALVAFAGIPPIQVVRVLVLSTRYSRHRYALAVALGRFPRFFLLAVFGQLLSPPPWLMTALTLAFLAWAAFLVIRGARRTKPSASRPPS
jgi:uncharacterized membrane protein YdjX (TVP38/TMEM64 family)